MASAAPDCTPGRANVLPDSGFGAQADPNDSATISDDLSERRSYT